MAEYWERRKGLEYYKKALEFLLSIQPPPAKVLDVGAGISKGCQYLLPLPLLGYSVAAVEKKEGSDRLPGVEVVFADFMSLKIPPPGTFDIIICLQTIEHVQDAEGFVGKMLQMAPKLVLSWPEDPIPCKNHVREFIPAHEVRSWVGRGPIHTAKCRRIRVSGFDLTVGCSEESKP